MDNFQNSNNISDYPLLNTTNTFVMDPTLESELKKLLEDKNKSKDLKLDKISYLSKNIQGIGNQIPPIFHNITRLYLSNNNIITLEGIEQFANLTHLSISYNLIEDIYELNRIINPEILLHLNVKGNFFCKNPSFSEVILNLFLNLKTLDDLKINNSHKNQIKYGQELSKMILPFILDLQEKIDKISTIQNVYQMNQEYNMINSSSDNLQNNINNEKLNGLLDELNNIDENSILQILSLINEKKIINNNNTLSINELNKLINNYLNRNSNNALIISENNKIKNIYEALFSTLILNQKRKDYRGFLNYLIMTSDQKLLEFIKIKGNNLKNIEMSKISFNILCQNFEKIILNNSNYSIGDINEIQMMIFYMYFNGNNILTNNDDDIQIVVDEKDGKEKIILNNYEQKVANFREMIPEYFPMFPLDNEFMKSLSNFIKEKINTLLNFTKQIKKGVNNQKNINMNMNINNNEKNRIQENKANKPNKIGKNKENVNNKKINSNNNYNNNFNEEMINDSNEDRVNLDYNNRDENLDNNNNNIYNNRINYNNEQKDENEYNNNFDQQLINYSDNDLKNSGINNNKLIKSKSSNSNYNNTNSSKKPKNNIYIQENQEDYNDNNNKSSPNINADHLVNYDNTYDQNENNSKFNPNLPFNNTVPNLEPNMNQIQHKYDIIQCFKSLNNMIENHKYLDKHFFFDNLKRKQYISKIGQIFFTVQTTLFRLKLKLFFHILKNIESNKITPNNNMGNIYFNYPTNKYHYKLNFLNEQINNKNNNANNQKALFFYYRNLKKKIFKLFKFNFFCYNKKANLYILNKNKNNNQLTETEDEKNNININEENNLQKYLNDENLLNSNVYKFFHGNDNAEKDNNDDNDNNKDNINYNINDTSANINKSIENSQLGNNNISSNNNNEYIEDENYNNALKLRKILEDKDEEIDDINAENEGNDNINEPKNEVDKLLDKLNGIYQDINKKCKNNKNSSKSKKKEIGGNYNNNKNTEYINRLKEIREKEKEKARKKYNKYRKLDENKLLGVPNFLKNTYNSMSKKI